MQHRQTPCPWCGATLCDDSNAFHAYLRRHDLHPWCWSGVGDGWLPIVEALTGDLRALGWSGKVAQIKEKFGTLRFYAEQTNAAMEARIRLAEDASAVTCERCGLPGALSNNGNIATLCPAHTREHQRR